MNVPTKPAAKAANRHHYIPQFLLRQFALPGSTDDYIRVLTRRGVLPRESVSNVAVERDFYTPCSVFSDPEGKLSEQEAVYASSIREWTNQRQLSEKAGDRASEFAWHLRLRSKTFRTHGQEIIDAIKMGMMAGAEQVVHASQPKSTLPDALRKLFTKPTDTDDTQRLAKILTDHLYSWALGTTFGLRNDPFTTQFIDMLIPHLHTTLVMRQLVNRADKNKQRRWRVQPVKGPLLLGDCGPLVLPKGARSLEHYFLAGPDAAIFLPIASDRLLIGSSSLESLVPTTADINRGTLELSAELVVGRWTVEQFERNAKYIGKRSAAAIDKIEIVQQTSSVSALLTQASRGAVEYFVAKHLGLNPPPFEPPDLIPGDASKSDAELATALADGVMSAGNAAKAATKPVTPTDKQKTSSVAIVIRRKTKRAGARAR